MPPNCRENPDYRSVVGTFPGMKRMKLRCRAPHVAVFFVMGALLGPAFTAPARAQEKNDYSEEWHNVLGVIGFGQEHEPIDYSARPLIAVPPSYDLPAPNTAAVQHPAGFPQDPDVASRRKALLDARRPIPPGENPGATKARSYLIEPPAEYLDAAKVAATGHDAVGGEAPKEHHHHHKSQDEAQTTPAPGAAPAPAAAPAPSSAPAPGGAQ